MSNQEYLESASAEITKSREDIFDRLLSPKLEPSFTVLDYGCGPGYLAKAVSPNVKRIYAVDISSGAIACAKIVNYAGNIEYHDLSKGGLDQIPDGSVDAIYSYAVVQHVGKAIFETILENCRKKLKLGGKLILHIQFPDDIWKTEEEWVNDVSVAGKVKLNFGLHCFGRTEDEYTELVEKHGFSDTKVELFTGFDAKYDKELESQRILVAYKRS